MSHAARLGGTGPGVEATSAYDAAQVAVQAALDAGARYADARVMHRRNESMTARNGEIESLTQDASSGIGIEPTG